MSTNFHIDDIGNLILRDGTLGLFVSSQNVAPPHYGGGRVGALCPYTVEQVSHFYPYGGLHGDNSSNGDFQRFKYNGKELDRVNGIDWYDYGARHYDLSTARFTTMDPLAEKDPSVSPYAYCAGDPVNCVDLDGREPSKFEAWLMSAAAYDDYDAETHANILQALRLFGWFEYDNSKTGGSALKGRWGYSSCVFSKTTDGKTEYCLAFAGTNDVMDAIEDKNQLYGTSQQYACAITEAHSLIELVGDAEVTFTGHSLVTMFAAR